MSAGESHTLLVLDERAVPEEFRRLVAERIAEARERALESLKGDREPSENPPVPNLGTKHGPYGKVCAGCGCDYEERTRGCSRCSARHRKRERFGNARGEALRALGPATCSACGVEVDEETPDCRTCYHRHRERRRLRGLPPRKVACSECGTRLDTFTPTCVTCRFRWYARRRRGVMVPLVSWQIAARDRIAA